MFCTSIVFWWTGFFALYASWSSTASILLQSYALRGPDSHLCQRVMLFLIHSFSLQKTYFAAFAVERAKKVAEDSTTINQRLWHLLNSQFGRLDKAASLRSGSQERKEKHDDKSAWVWATTRSYFAQREARPSSPSSIIGHLNEMFVIFQKSTSKNG